jgi:hypothetical protein
MVDHLLFLSVTLVVSLNCFLFTFLFHRCVFYTDEILLTMARYHGHSGATVANRGVEGRRGSNFSVPSSSSGGSGVGAAAASRDPFLNAMADEKVRAVVKHWDEAKYLRKSNHCFVSC